MKQKQTAVVASQREIAPQIFDMWITTDLAADARPGQFVCVYPKDRSTLLPRPISICETDRRKGFLRLVYRVTGAHTGTEEFSKLVVGDEIDIIGPLGNGFPLEEAEGKRLLARIGERDYVAALAIDGEMPDSEGLPAFVGRRMNQGDSRICFVIGGSCGLSAEVMKRADTALSFSKLTFPHQLMRVILLEQIYRSFRILNHEPYHK